MLDLKGKQDKEIATEFVSSIMPYLSDEKKRETVMPILKKTIQDMIKTHPTLVSITIAAIAIYHKEIAEELKKLV